MIKTNNYFNKREGEYTTAVGLVQVDTKLGTATLYIGKSRDLILSGNYYEKTPPMYLNFDRSRNPYEQAYEVFKNYEFKKMVGEKVITEKPFADWIDYKV